METLGLKASPTQLACGFISSSLPFSINWSSEFSVTVKNDTGFPGSSSVWLLKREHSWASINPIYTSNLVLEWKQKDDINLMEWFCLQSYWQFIDCLNVGSSPRNQSVQIIPKNSDHWTGQRTSQNCARFSAACHGTLIGTLLGTRVDIWAITYSFVSA